MLPDKRLTYAETGVDVDIEVVEQPGIVIHSKGLEGGVLQY